MRDSWENLTIDDIVEDISDGGTPPRTDSENFGGSIPWVVIDDIKSEIYTTKEYLSEKGFKNCSSKLWPINTLILSTGATIGEVGLAKVPLTTKQGIAGIKLKEIIDIDYAYYIFLSLKNEIQRLSQGSTIQEIRPKYLKQIGVKITNNKLQQRKIASILSTCDQVIEKTEAAIAKYQALKQGMMHDLFTRGIDVNTGKLRASYQDAPELYKESELGMIPKEWEKCTFKDISSVNQGLQIPISLRHKTEGVNRFVYITIQYLNDIENEANRYYIENPTTSVVCNEDDVLMVRTGNTGMIVTNIVGAFHNNFFKIDYGKNVVKEFLVYHLKRKSIQSIILNYAGTTTIPDLKHGDFYNLPFMMPSQIEQKIISTRLDGIDNKLQTEQSALAKYQQLKAGLMQDLLTGKVEVSVAEEILKN
ncbi:restriction endonuclease subunit S [Flavobacteriaceae bacterium]|nr:restriction endonuclease subunit S [Flavobacteriaceae bacterium]